MNEANVYLEGRLIGRLQESDDKHLTLSFVDSYLTDEMATTMSVAFPKRQPLYEGEQVQNWLWGLLPDNDDVLRRWARDQDTSLASPFGLLTSEIGLDCAGAIQFTPRDRDVNTIDRDSGLQGLSDDEIEADLVQLRRDATAWRGRSSTGQFSLAGAQSKTALHFVDGQWSRPRGEVPSTHILKPAPSGWPDLDVNEHICLATARELGLSAAQTTVREFGSERVIVVKRYDRLAVADGLERVHQEDLCQASGLHPRQKYEPDGGPTAARVAEILRSAVEPHLTEREVSRFADALIFNWLIGATDGHAKNYSIVHYRGQARLAPLYDVSSMLPYDDSGGRGLKIAMKVGGEYRAMRIDHHSWATEATNLGLDSDALLARCAELSEQLPIAMETVVAAMPDLSRESDVPDRLVEATRKRSEACLEALASGHSWRRIRETATFAIIDRDHGPKSDLPQSDTTSVNMRLVVRPPGETEWYYYQFIAARWQNLELMSIGDPTSQPLANRLVGAAISAAQHWVCEGQPGFTDNAIDAVVLAMDTDLNASDLTPQDGDATMAVWTDDAEYVKRSVSQMEPIGAGLSRLGVRRAELEVEAKTALETPVEVEARRQLADLGKSMRGFESAVRQLSDGLVLAVRPDSERVTDAFGKVVGFSGDPIRLITVRIDRSGDELIGIVASRPGTWGYEPSRQSLDDRQPQQIVSALLDGLADSLALELHRLERELS